MEFLSYFMKPTESPNQKNESKFQLPIAYLESANKSDLHVLQSTVATDLELDTLTANNQTTTKSEKEKGEPAQKPIYDHLFLPQHSFAKETIFQWKSHFTSNRDFLLESQEILKKMGEYKSSVTEYQESIGFTMDESACEKIKKVWTVVKDDALFLEKYGYMELDLLKSLNRRPAFLQTMSIVNMTSPILSFLIPVVMLILPFFLLKIQGVPISFEKYFEVLSNIAKHHIIGKSISTFQNFSASNLAYFLMMAGFYAYQIYQNYLSCVRFYRNMKDMNDYLMDTKLYLSYSIHSMLQYSDMLKTCKCSQYAPFYNELQTHVRQLQSLQQVLSVVEPFVPSLSKINEIGTLLRCFYELYENEGFGVSLQWSFGFEGYMNNLLGVYENMSKGNVAFAHYLDVVVDTADVVMSDHSISDVAVADKKDNSLLIKNQVYPPHLVETFVKNDCVLDKNMIITGPNAAGKTTFLKTTIINIILSQQLGCGYYSECAMVPYHHIHSYLNIPDTSARDSLFQAESRRCKEILDAIDCTKSGNKIRHFCVFDELYSGTNPAEATKSAYAFLLYLSNFPTVDFILTTHYVSICKKLKKKKSVRIQNWKMEAAYRDSADGSNGVDDDAWNPKIHYTYKIKKGISKIQGALCVLREMEYPAEIIKTIREYQ